MEKIAQMFLRVFPRPQVRDQRKAHIGVVLSDLCGIAFLVTCGFGIHSLIFGARLGEGGAAVFSLFALGMLSLRPLLRSGMIVAVVWGAVVVIGATYSGISMLSSTVFHSQLMLLCMGIVLATMTLGKWHGLGVLFLYSGILWVGDEWIVTAERSDNELAAALAVMSAFWLTGERLRDYLWNHAETAMAQRDEAQKKLERANAKLEDMLRAASSELDAVKTAAAIQKAENERIIALGGLASGLSHELSSPMGTALDLASSLQHWANALVEAEGMSADRRLKIALKIGDSSAMIVKRIGDANRMLESFKQVSMDRIEERVREVSCIAVAEEAAFNAKTLLDGRDIRVKFNIPKDLRATTYRNAMEAVLSNVLQNAVIHGFEKREEGLIMVTGSMIEGDRIRIEIADNGWGIPHDIQPRVFEPFFTTRRQSGMTGMGLSVAHHLTTAILKGTIYFASNPSGTSFRVDIPRETPRMEAVMVPTSTMPGRLL